MDMHGFDDPIGGLHAMYAPDAHDPDGDGLGQDGLDLGGSADTHLSDDVGAVADPRDHGTIELDLGGRRSEVPATLDTDHDGRADSAVLGTDDGNQVIVTDSDHDGVADRAVLIDAHGNVVDSATFDEASGHWHHADEPAGTGSGHTTQPSTDSDKRSPEATGPVAGASSAPDHGNSVSPAGPHRSGPQIEVDAAGNHAQVAATLDTDHDGRPDTAVVDGGDGTSVAFTDTDHDGRADEAALVSGGHVTETAYIDPRSGQWVRGDDGHNPFTVGDQVPTGATVPAGPPTGPGAGSDSDAGVETTAGTTTGAVEQDKHVNTDEATSTASSSTGSGHGGPIIVDAGGRTSTVEATLDANHDGTNETAIVHGPDGSQVAFSDTDGDGEADRATVFDANGNVVGTARFDPATGEWRDER